MKQVNNKKLQEVILNKTLESIQAKPKAEAKKSDPKTKGLPKIKRPKESPVKKVNKKLIEEVSTVREVKYLYPEDCITSMDRKKFRCTVRATLHKLELKMGRVDSSSKEFKALQKEYNDYRKKYLKGAAGLV
jgi:hypothetical protein